MKWNLSAGFTLIELVIVFSVIAILSIMGIASFVSYSNAQVLVNDSNNLITILNKARSDALSQVRDSTSTCVGNLDGYRVDINTTSNTSYSLVQVCDSGNTKTIGNPYSLSKYISFDTNNTYVKSVYFHILTGKIDITVRNNGNLSSANLVLIYSLTNAKRQITIDDKGVISSTSL